MGGICTSVAAVDTSYEETVVPVTLSKGGFYGEESLVNGSPYSHTIVARGHVSLLVLSSTAFRRLCDTEGITQAKIKGHIFTRERQYLPIIHTDAERFQRRLLPILMLR
jgi:CRP-like cAMP-binding protein